MENQRGNQETEENADHAIANVVEICIGRKSLEDTVEKSEGDLKPGVTDPFASRCYPPGNRGRTGNDDHERGDCFHVWHQEHDRDERECSANQATGGSQRSLVKRRFGAVERDKVQVMNAV